MFKIRFLLIVFGLIFLTNSISKAQSASFSIDQPTGEYCKGIPVIFTNTSTGDFVNTQWKFGDGIDTWGNSPQHIYLTAGTFTTWIIITSSTGLQDSVSKEIIIHPAPVIELENNLDDQMLTVHTGLSEVSFLWYFGTNLTDETDSVIYYMETGYYGVVAYNEYCTDSASFYVNFDSLPPDLQPEIVVKNNILTPDLADGANDVLFIEDLGLYTNKVTIQIFNKWGQLVYKNDEYTNLSGFSGFDNSGNKLDAGTYYYIVKCEGRKGGSGFVDIIR